MHDPNSVEAVLARLMPPALSESGQRDIEAMLDDLAGAARATPAPFRLPLIAGGIAAVLTAALVILQLGSPAPRVAATSVRDSPPEIVLMGGSGRIEAMRDEGWREDADGSAMRALRMRVVEENSLFDEETGILMRVSEPREELLLMPVSAF